MDNEIDIILVTYNRLDFTKQTLRALYDRTPIKYRIIVVDNGSSDNTSYFLAQEKQAGRIDKIIFNRENLGLEEALNRGFQEVRSEYFVTIDNDIIVSDYWLPRLVDLMKSNQPFYAAISCRPQILIGVGQIFKTDKELVENNVVGGSARLMRTADIKEVGGWSKGVKLNDGRGREEWDICTKLRVYGYKVGYAKNIWCYHLFGDDEKWGYESSGVDYRMGRVLDKSPKDIKYNPATCEPEQKANE